VAEKQMAGCFMKQAKITVVCLSGVFHCTAQCRKCQFGFQKDTMTLPQFADHYRLKLVHDECGDPIVHGRLGNDSNISEYSDTELTLCWLPDGKTPARSGLWKRTKAKCVAAGMTLHQDGDAEGIFIFDPADAGQAKLAIKCVKAKAKRQMTPERLAALSETLVKARKACQERVF